MAQTSKAQFKKVGIYAQQFRKKGYSNEVAMEMAWDKVKGEKGYTGKSTTSNKTSTPRKTTKKKPTTTTTKRVNGQKVSLLEKIFG